MTLAVARVFMCSLIAAGLAHAQWKPLAPEDMSAKPVASEDAVALFRDVRILNEASTFGYPHNVIQEYVRLKIFTTRGRDEYGTVRIPYWGKTTISNVAGRTIQPDGTIVELKKEEIFEKVVEKSKGGPKVQAISFAMPAVEPGSIVEYRYTENIGEFISRYVPIEAQSEFPVRELDIHVKPVSSQWVQWPKMHYFQFGCKVEEAKHESGDFTWLVVRDIPAFHDEPYSPPAFNVKQWILLYYEENETNDPDKYWASIARNDVHAYNSEIKIDGNIKQIAAEVTAGAQTDADKVDKLFEYCRKNLKDIHGTEISTEERDKAKQNRNTANTIRNREGTAFDIKLAFVALAGAAGFEAHIARLSNRSEFLFDPKMLSPFFLSNTDVAVKVGNGWRFYNVENRWLPPGGLPWQEQGTRALIENGNEPGFVTTPLLPASSSAVQRLGTLKVSSEGTLEGDLREIYSGNKAVEFREKFGDANDAEREAMFRGEVKQRFAEFELTGVKFALSPDLSKPVGVVYHISVPGYVQRTGKRMFVNPAFFAAGYGARFTETDRKLPVYFPYPWSESDFIELQLPEGYQLDHADAPAAINMPQTLTYSVSMSITTTNKLSYRRTFSLGGSGVLIFDAKDYPTIKKIFDHVHESDNHILTLKAEAPTTAEVH